MKKYVALLRGINVGGNAKVEMPRLVKLFETVGCGSPKSYINSGNIIFMSDREPDELALDLEAAIAKEFKLTVPVLVRSQVLIDKLCQEIPESWTNGSAGSQTTNVLFLWDSVMAPNVLDTIAHKPEIERLRYIDGVVVWNVDRVNARRSSLSKLIANPIYKFMTVRNINTVRKLKKLLDEL